jgi:hypothetical protein
VESSLDPIGGGITVDCDRKNKVAGERTDRVFESGHVTQSEALNIVNTHFL